MGLFMLAVMGFHQLLFDLRRDKWMRPLLDLYAFNLCMFTQRVEE